MDRLVKGSPFHIFLEKFRNVIIRIDEIKGWLLFLSLH